MHYTESEKILRLETRIPAYHVSLNGQAKFYTLASMLLESTAIHASMHGFGYHDMIRDKIYWVLSRFQIMMHSYPVMNEPIVIETWHKGVNKLFFTRDYKMYSEDNRPLASATTAWLVLDGNTGRPKKMAEEGNPYQYAEKELHAIENLPDKLPAIPEPDRQISVTAKYSDLDMYKHVNAAKYIEWIQDCYGEETYESKNICEFQINYHLETKFGEEVDIRIKHSSGDDPFDYFEGIRNTDQHRAFRARINFGGFK
jgi:acyl-ACP thioesterase